MPRVESYGQQRVAPTNMPSTTMSSHPTPESEGAGIGEAIAGFGATAAKVGMSGLTEMWRRERERKVEVENLSALTKLNELDRSLMHDPTNGFLNKRGMDPMHAREAYLEQFDAETAKIRGGLTSNEAVSYVDRQVAARRSQLRERMDDHASDEYARYQTSEVNAFLTSSVQTAIANADRPDVVLDQLQQQAKTIDTHGQQALGMGPAARKEAIEKLRSQTWTGVIEDLLARDQDQAAQQLFDKVTSQDGQLSGDDQTRLRVKLEAGTTDGTAMRASAEIWAAHAPINDQDPISLDAMEAEARTRFADNPKVFKATIEYLRSQKAGVDNGRRERLDARDDTLWTAVSKGVPLATLRTMPEYGLAQGKTQEQIREFYQRDAEHQDTLANLRASRANADESRRYTQALRAEKERANQQWPETQRLSDPAILSTLSRADILRKLPELGRENVDDLLTAKKKLTEREATIKTITLDHDQLVQAASDAGMAFAVKTPGSMTQSQREQMSAFTLAVKSEIAARQEQKGEKLDFDETQSAIVSVAAKQVRLNVWGADPTVVAAVVNKDQAPSAYVPIAQVPLAEQNEFVTSIRLISPSAQADTRDQVLQKYGDRIEKAYAARLLGLGTDAEQSRLKGQ